MPPKSVPRCQDGAPTKLVGAPPLLRTFTNPVSFGQLDSPATTSPKLRHRHGPATLQRPAVTVKGSAYETHFWRRQRCSASGWSPIYDTSCGLAIWVQ